jgi:hypothetical protein
VDASASGQNCERDNPGAILFFQVEHTPELGARVTNALLVTMWAINNRNVEYNPIDGPNSNSVAFTLLTAVAPILGISNVGIFQGYMPILGLIGATSVNNQIYIFPGWGQNLLN